MGTSHIVEVINDGKLVIRQYGQTDGIAEIAGSYICNFLKEHDAEYFVNGLKRLGCGSRLTNAQMKALHQNITPIERNSIAASNTNTASIMEAIIISYKLKSATKVLQKLHICKRSGIFFTEKRLFSRV